MTSLALSAEALVAAGAGVGPVLGIDTGGPLAKLGLVTGGRIIASITRQLSSHASGLPDAVEHLLADSRINLRELAGIAVALGPGSFTGLRIGLSYAKGIASASKLALVGVPTLDSMALAAIDKLDHRAEICPVIDARRGEVYAALYRLGTDGIEKITDDLALRPNELVAMVSREVVFTGETIAMETASLARTHGLIAPVIEDGARNGGYLAALGAARIAQQQTDDAATLEPRYVRAADARRPTPP